MAKQISAVRKAQIKLNVRNAFKASFNTAICLLNKDFREDLVDYVLANAKSGLKDNQQDLTQMQFNPALTITRRAVTNVFDTIELNTCVDEAQLSTDTLKGHIRKSIDITLKASGWSREELDSLHNGDYSAMTISNKCSYALAHPKEDSLYAEAMSYVMLVLSPVMATYERMKEGVSEIAEEASKHKVESDIDYKRINGVLVHKDFEHVYVRKQLIDYLTNDLYLSEENAKNCLTSDGKQYELPLGLMELRSALVDNKLSYDEYNKAIAELIAKK